LTLSAGCAKNPPLLSAVFCFCTWLQLFAFCVDGIAIVIGSLLGCAPLTVYIESASGGMIRSAAQWLL
jgi:hypothetical protein